MSVDGGSSTHVMVQGRNSSGLLNDMMNRRGRGRSGSGNGEEGDVVDEEVRAPNNPKQLTRADKRRLLHEVRQLLGGGETSLLSGSGLGQGEYDEEPSLLGGGETSLLSGTSGVGQDSTNDNSTSFYTSDTYSRMTYLTVPVPIPVADENVAYVSDDNDDDDDEDDEYDDDDIPPRPSSQRGGRTYCHESGGISSCAGGRAGAVGLVVDEYDSLDEYYEDDGVFVGACNAILSIMTCGVTGGLNGADVCDEKSNDPTDGGAAARRRARGGRRDARDSKTKRSNSRRVVVDDDRRGRETVDGWAVGDRGNDIPSTIARPLDSKKKRQDSRRVADDDRREREDDRVTIENAPCPIANIGGAMHDDPPLERERTVDPPGELFDSDYDDVMATDVHDIDEDRRVAVVHVVAESTAEEEEEEEEVQLAAAATHVYDDVGPIPSIAKPGLIARVRSLSRTRRQHRSRNESDATASSGSIRSLIVSDAPETLGRAKSFALHQQLTFPFVRARESFSNTKSSKVSIAVAGAEVTKDNDGGGSETTCSDPSSGTNNEIYQDGPETFGIIACSTMGSAISRLNHKSKEAWWEYTDDRYGRSYYSNGIISTWERPVDVTIHVAPYSSPKRSTRSRTTSPPRRDRQGTSSTTKRETVKSSAIHEHMKAMSSFTKNKASHALANFVDSGDFRRALALSSGKLGNDASRNPRQ
jgi:hypothetical protein